MHIFKIVIGHWEVRITITIRYSGSSDLLVKTIKSIWCFVSLNDTHIIKILQPSPGICN
jgi:hypothetical protein